MPLPPFLWLSFFLLAAAGGIAAWLRVRHRQPVAGKILLPKNYAILGTLVSAAVLVIGWTLVLNSGLSMGTQHLLAAGVGFLGVLLAMRSANPAVNAPLYIEKTIIAFLWLCSAVAVLTTIGIILSLVFETARFFQKVPIGDFLFGLRWSPQIALRADQAGSSGAFGAIPLLAGTLMITCIALLVAVPIGLMSAIYTSEYASHRTRNIVKPLLELLAGIPTVVYGFFAVTIVAPFLRDAGAGMGFTISTESALAAGVVMGVMIIPFMSSLSDDIISAVPDHLRNGALALGATRNEMIRQVILPTALPGIVGAFLLALSRAVGETMIVAMAAGMSANLTANPFEAVTTVTVQIVKLLIGDQEFNSPKTLAAFALGLLLFTITLVLNIIALKVVHKYREKYD